MLLNKRALERVRAIILQGDEVANMFKLLAENASSVDSAESLAALHYKTDGTAQLGEYIPQIHLVVTKVTKENLSHWDKG